MVKFTQSAFFYLGTRQTDRQMDKDKYSQGNHCILKVVPGQIVVLGIKVKPILCMCVYDNT